MTFFSPPLALPPPTDVRHPRQHIASSASSGALSGVLIDLDLLIGTNSALAPSAAAIAFVPSDSATHAGRELRNASGTYQARLVGEIRARTELSYLEIAAMLGVERRTIYFWLDGRPISDANLQRLESVARVVRNSDVGDTMRTTEAVRLMVQSDSVPTSEDRLRDFRIREGTPAARMPYFNVVTLLGGPPDGADKA
jgi:hypothetical protein